MTLILSVDAFNVLVLIPLTVFRLDNCPDPSIWDQVFVNNVDGSTDVRYCQMRVWECGIVNGIPRGNVHPHPSPLPSRERGLIGVLCFSLGSRLRGNDVGVRGNDGARGDDGCRGNDVGVAGEGTVVVGGGEAIGSGGSLV